MQFFGYEPFLRRRCYLENGEHVKSRRTLLWCALSFVGILVLHCRCVWNRSCRFLCVFVLGSNAAVSPSARARARVEMTASLCTRVSFFYRWGAFVVSEDVPRVFQSVISCVSVASKAYRIGLVSLLR